MQEQEFLAERSYNTLGIIEVVCGPMFSGKTEELIRRLKRAQIACQRVMVFKPQIDDRYHKKNIVSHSNQSFLSQAVGDPSDIKAILEGIDQTISVVGLDEAQFFGTGIIELVENLAQNNVRVIIAGLDQDYLGKPFGPMAELLAIADMVTKQCAVCVVCGAPATKTQRVMKQHAKKSDTSHSQIYVGSTESYEARCRQCYVKDLDIPRARAPKESPQSFRAVATSPS